MSAYLRTPHKLKNGPLYRVIEVSCTIVTVIGYGKVLKTIFPITLLLDDTMYQIMHNANTLKMRLLFSTVILMNTRTIFFCFLLTSAFN